MQTFTRTLTNASGLHARPAALLVQTAKRFQSDISLKAHGKVANAKSILSVLSLGVSPGHSVELVATGEDEVDALNVIRQLFDQGLGE